jgi:biopolymer transport protein ExbD
MAKIKMKKKASSTDMTAMCDVAFLLLTFFILTATAKIPEPLPVDTPASTVQSKLPDLDLATITVGKKKVFFDVKGREVRIKTLEMMGEKYGVVFTDKEKQKFSLMEAIGVPITSLKDLIAMKTSDRSKEDLQPGIPKDSTDNQLKDWLLFARNANKVIDKKDLQVAIKGDAKEEYPAIKKIMDILQDQEINDFNLVTGLRAKQK